MVSPSRSFTASRHLCLLLAATIALAMVSCKSSGDDKLIPVSGKITLGGEPLAGVLVTFNPDSAKGNMTKLLPAGKSDASGGYSLASGGKPGAPVGWYKVTITDPPPSGEPAPKHGSIHGSYQNVEQTPVSIEITASPPAGGYDLKLSK